MANSTDLVVFEQCVQKLAEARITIAAINDVTGLGITVNPVTGEVTAVVGGVVVPIDFEFCCVVNRAVFSPTLLTGKIINCGWVNGAILIRNLDTGMVLTCLNVALTFQDEVVAVSVLPSDTITEQVAGDEGSAICIVFSTNTFTAITEPVLIVKCVILVLITVMRGVSVICPTTQCPTTCPPTTQAPTTCPPTCPPTTMAPTTCCPPTTMAPISCPPTCLTAQTQSSCTAGSSTVKIFL
ncbi:MAG: hypothetical protein VR69_06255 [Peptococcaceae bacterium BRH_c4b]|nr:MAG: hypothetical protein VR69_06255 [Peptococcaceae bacterium BRH_c4b]